MILAIGATSCRSTLRGRGKAISIHSLRLTSDKITRTKRAQTPTMMCSCVAKSGQLVGMLAQQRALICGIPSPANRTATYPGYHSHQQADHSYKM